MKQGKKNLIALWETLNIYKSGYTKSFSQNFSRNQEAYYFPFSKIIILESKSLMQNFGWKTHKMVLGWYMFSDNLKSYQNPKNLS